MFAFTRSAMNKIKMNILNYFRFIFSPAARGGMRNTKYKITYVQNCTKHVHLVRFT